MRTTSPREVRQQLTPINIVGKNIDTAIAEANEERKQIISDLKNGIDKTKTKSGELMTVEALWLEYINETNQTANYIKNNTYFFNKHMKPLFMPCVSKKEQVSVRYEEMGLMKEKKLWIDTPIKNKDGKIKIKENRITYIKDITETVLRDKWKALYTGSFILNRKDPETIEGISLHQRISF